MPPPTLYLVKMLLIVDDGGGTSHIYKSLGVIGGLKERLKKREKYR